MCIQRLAAVWLGNWPKVFLNVNYSKRQKRLLVYPSSNTLVFLEKSVTKIAVCGGAGIFLLPAAIAAGAHAYITADVKYHDFFDADDRILLADIGHYESEQFTVELLSDFLQQKFPNFAVLKTEINTNPVNYI